MTTNFSLSPSIYCRAAGRVCARGFTVHELLISLGVVSVLSLTSVGVGAVVGKTRVTASVNEVLTTLALARSEAIKRGGHTVLCPSSDGARCTPGKDDHTAWQHGLIAFVDENGNRLRESGETVVRVIQSFPGRVQVKSSKGRGKITFQPNGFSAGYNLSMTICEASTPPRYIVLYGTGRARISDQPADGRADAGHERCS